jgi:hypothetical protein
MPPLGERENAATARSISGNVQGRKIEGGNWFEAPRKREYPLPPLLDDQAGIWFNAAAKKLGYHPFPTPRAIVSQPYNGRPACTYCGFCQAFGCHVGAKSSILVTKLPEADATGNFKLITGAMCYRVNSDTSGRATGVSYYVARVYLTFDDRHINVYMGPSAQKHSIDNFNGDNFDHASHVHGRADRKPSLHGPDDRPRSECAGCLGSTCTAHHLRLAATQRSGPD